MFDQEEQTRRGQPARRKGTKHPYAAIEHRVIDSPAYADLTFAARSVLLLIARQLTASNNGRLQATYSYLSRFGIGSEHTLSRAIADLISHGFIYRTRAGGYQNGAAQYAVTWLSVKAREGLFLDAFKPCAWREWKAGEKKSPPAKMQEPSCKNGSGASLLTALSAGGCPPKIADNELIPCRTAVFVHGGAVAHRRVPGKSISSPYAIRLRFDGDRALPQCVP